MIETSSTIVGAEGRERHDMSNIFVHLHRHIEG